MRLHRLTAPALASLILLSCSLAWAPPASADFFIEEAGFQCASGDSSLAFVELAAVGPTATDSRMGLRAFDAAGNVLFDVPGVFGPGSQILPDGATFLVGTLALGGRSGWLLDRSIARGPATGRGRVQLYQRIGTSILSLSTLSYGGVGQVPAPPAGQSLRRSGSTYVVNPTPMPYGRLMGPGDWTSTCIPIPPPPPPRHLLVVTQAASGCADGASAGGYVELRAEVGDVHLGPGTVLQINGNSVALDPLRVPGGVVELGKSYLVAAPGFAARAGVTPDLEASGFELAAGLGECRFSVADSVGVPMSSMTIPYRPGFAFGPGPVELPAPSPRNNAGATSSGLECFDPALFASRLRIRELFLRCRLGSDLVQYVAVGIEPESSLPYPGNFGMRAFDHAGALRFDVWEPFGARTGSAWPAAGVPGQVHTAVFGSPATADLWRTPADSLLTALSFDELGGRVELYAHVVGGDRILDHVEYGPGGTAVPDPGASLVRGVAGVLEAADVPWTYRLAGSAVASPCLGRLPIGRMGGTDVLLGVDPPDAGFTDFTPPLNNPPPSEFRQAASVGPDSMTYDLRHGTVHIGIPTNPLGTNGRGFITLDAVDDFTVSGLPLGTEFDLRVRFAVTRWDYYAGDCNRQFPEGTFCFPALGWMLAGMSVNGRYGRYIHNGPPGVSADSILHVRVGEPFTLGLYVTAAAGGPNGIMRFDGQLQFGGLPPGAVIQSVFGYGADQPVATQLALSQADFVDGAVRLEWFAAGDRPDVQLERKIDSGAWSPLTPLSADGTGRYHYEDFSVARGTTVAYRLVWQEGGALRSTAPATLEIPLEHRFALRGVRPNPSAGASQLAFTLDRAGEVRLAVHDLLGRRVLERRWTLAAGEYNLPLARAGELKPGLYVVRLSHHGRALTTRAIVRP